MRRLPPGVRVEIVPVEKIVGSRSQPNDWLEGMKLNPNLEEHRRKWHEGKSKSLEECWTNKRCRLDLQLTQIPMDCTLEEPDCDILSLHAKPIRLIKKGDQYFVRYDGNHRVVLAKTKGLKEIVALVVDEIELQEQE